MNRLELDKKQKILISHRGSAWAYKISVDEQDDLQFERIIMKPPAYKKPKKENDN